MYRSAHSDIVRVGFLVPTTGPTGIYGPSCLACGELAVEQLNSTGGILGRRVVLQTVDAGRAPYLVASDVARLVERGAVDALAGWHISAVRNAVTQRVGGKVLYAYAAMHEGRDDTPGVFMLGERPANQLLPSARRLAEERGIRRWAVVGNSYIFPRVSAAVARTGLAQFGAQVVMERFVALGTGSFGRVLEEIETSGADGVLMFLMGQDAVHFNRAFALWPWSRELVRLSPAIEENTLLGAGARANDNVFAAAAYFDGLATPDALPLATAYNQRFGPYAPFLNAVGESCYEALLFLAVVAQRCGSLDVGAWERLRDGEEYQSPRGLMRLRGNLVEQTVYLAKAAGLRFDIGAPLESH